MEMKRSLSRRTNSSCTRRTGARQAILHKTSSNTGLIALANSFGGKCDEAEAEVNGANFVMDRGLTDVESRVLGESGFTRLKRMVRHGTALGDNSWYRNHSMLQIMRAKEKGGSRKVDARLLVQAAAADEWQLVSCASLPFTFLFFMLFVMFFQQHYKIADIYFAERKLRTELGYPATQLSEPTEIYDWLENKFLPYMWMAQPNASSASKRMSPSLYQELVGGVTLTTGRLKATPCEDALVAHMECYSARADSRRGDAFAGLTDSSRRLLADGTSPEAVAAAAAVSMGFQWEDLPAPPEGDWTATGRLVGSGAGAPSVDARGRRRRGLASRFLGGRSRRRPQGQGPAQTLGRAVGRQGSQGAAAGRRLKLSQPAIRDYFTHGKQEEVSTLILPGTDSLSKVLEVAQMLRNISLLRETTHTFETKCLVRNNNIPGRELLSVFQVIFTIDRGGGVYAQPVITTLILDQAKDMVYLVLGPAWLVCLIAFSCLLPSRVYDTYTKGTLLLQFFRFWNLIEWAIVIFGWVVIFSWLVERGQIWAMVDTLEEFEALRAKSSPGSAMSTEEEDLYNQFQTRMIAVSSVSVMTQILVADYHVLLIFRFFMAVRGQPRLAIILNTVSMAATDLAHLVIVILLIFFAYAMSGHVLFGRRLAEYATFSNAFAKCFQIMMERQYPWDRFTEQDLFTSMFWVWSFLVLVTLVLVNITLAMIFDAYGEVRASVCAGPTLWRTSKQLLSQMRYALLKNKDDHQHWVPNQQLITSVKMMQSKSLTPWMLKEAFPGISNKQVNYLFNLATARYENSVQRNAVDMLPEFVASTLLDVEAIYVGLEKLLAETPGARPRDAEEAGDHVGIVVGDGAPEDAPSSAASRSPRFSPSGRAQVAPAPPKVAPAWVQAQLLPHLHMQAAALSRVKMQIQAIDIAAQEVNLSELAPPWPGEATVGAVADWASGAAKTRATKDASRPQDLFSLPISASSWAGVPFTAAAQGLRAVEAIPHSDDTKLSDALSGTAAQDDSGQSPGDVFSHNRLINDPRRSPRGNGVTATAASSSCIYAC